MVKKLIDFIHIIDNVMTPFVCDYILNEYENSNDWVFQKKYENYVIELSERFIIDENFHIREEIDRLIECSISRIVRELIKNYNNKYNIFNITDSGYQLISHINDKNYENNFLNSKMYAYIFLGKNLNSNKFSFFNGEVDINIKKGSALIFPNDKIYSYKISSSSKEPNYLIATHLI
jgi:hypothetical protein